MSDWMPWWLYRLRVRWRLWRHAGQWLNQRLEVQQRLLEYAKGGHWMRPEQCRELADKLGAPKL